MTEYLFLTEATLPRLLWRTAWRKPTCIIGTWSFVSGSAGGFLHRLTDRLRQHGRVSDLVADHADKLMYKDDIALIVGQDVFATNEKAIEAVFGFTGADSRFGRYALPYRHAVCNASIHRLLRAFHLRDIQRFDPTARFSGIEPETLALHHARFPDAPPLVIAGGQPARQLFNLFGAAAALAISALWTLRRIRWNPPPAKTVMFGSDFNNDYRDLELWRDLSDNLDQIVLVFRNAAMQAAGHELVRGWQSCNWNRGRFPILQGLACLGMLGRDVLALLRSGISLPPDLFRTLVGLPFHRAKFRGLLNLYRFRYFWDRADYNTDHIIRSQEIRAAGGQALGVMHGVVSIATVAHQVRYVDYDIYFAIGRYSYERFLREKWPAAMRVYAIGTLALTREEYRRLALREPRKNIAFFIEPVVQGHATLEVAARMAEALPDRKVYVNTKSKHLRGDYLRDMEAYCERLPNFAIHRGRSYDLMFECGYVFSDASTLTAEAVQFGLCGLTLDLIGDRWKENLFRSFPVISIFSAQEAIDTVTAIENGTLSYPRESYGDLIQLDGRTHFDIIRAALGLPVREEPHAALAFCPGPIEPISGS